MICLLVAAEFSLAAYRGEQSACPSPRIASFQAGQQDNDMQRSRSDGAGLLSGSCPHSFTQLPGMSVGGYGSARSAFPEGSLCSVTSAKVQSSAGPAAYSKRKVQNLEDLHDMRTAFRSKLGPCKEVRNTSSSP